jgi:hypothetical protein
VQELALDFLLDVMAGESHPIATRIDAAKAAVLYAHFRKELIDTSGRNVPITVQIVRFSDVTGELETRDRLGKPEPVTSEHDP